MIQFSVVVLGVGVLVLRGLKHHVPNGNGWVDASGAKEAIARRDSLNDPNDCQNLNHVVIGDLGALELDGVVGEHEDH